MPNPAAPIPNDALITLSDVVLTLAQRVLALEKNLDHVIAIMAVLGETVAAGLGEPAKPGEAP